MLVIDASVLVDALLVTGPSRARLASEILEAPELIDAPCIEKLNLLRSMSRGATRCWFICVITI